MRRAVHNMLSEKKNTISTEDDNQGNDAAIPIAQLGSSNQHGNNAGDNLDTPRDSVHLNGGVHTAAADGRGGRVQGPGGTTNGPGANTIVDIRSKNFNIGANQRKNLAET